MAKTVRGQISETIRDVEKALRQLRSEVQKQYDATPKVLDQAASQLRRGAAEAAYQVERYIREVRMDLEAASKASGKKGAKKKATKKRSTKRTAKRATKKATKKRTAKRATKKRTAKKAAPKKRAAKRSTAKKSTRKRR